MERMPYQDRLDSAMQPATAARLRSRAGGSAQVDTWRQAVPELKGDLITLRELRASDAPALFEALSPHEVSRFISPPPATVEGFERFIQWAIRQREAGQYLCFAVVPHGSDTPIGLFQVHTLEPGFGAAEWGFAIASRFWGSGAFVDGAHLVVDFAFGVLGTHRLEARAALENGRGTAALKKMGAVREGVLRKSLRVGGQSFDQGLWTILREDWMRSKAIWESILVH
jgi:RimJ/RimL family protein N-acetyltransferase